jgi:hypothetical protein
MDDNMTRTTFASALTTLGDLLASRGHVYEVVLIGGGNLLLRGIISRPTKDGDLLGELGPGRQIIRIEHLPEPLARAVRDIATTYGLKDDWRQPRSALDA